MATLYNGEGRRRWRESKNKAEKVFEEIMTDNVSNLMKVMNSQT